MNGLLSEYSLDSTERAISRLLASGKNRTRRELMRLLRTHGKPAEHKALICEAGKRITTVAGAVRVLHGRMGAVRLLLTCLLPPYAYFFFGRRARGTAFLAGYAALILYGILLVSMGDGGGWVYLFVAALAHLSAVMSLYELHVASLATECPS